MSTSGSGPASGEVERFTDKYFTKTRTIVETLSDCEVTYAVFMRRPVLSCPRLAVDWLRRVLAANADLARRLDEVESRLGDHDEQFVQVIRAIRELMQPAAPPKRRRIGFHQSTDDSPASARVRSSRSAHKR